MNGWNDNTLRLTDALESRQIPDGTRLVRQTDRAEYMALSPEDQKILDRFAVPGTARDHLRALLQEGLCPRIRHYYALVAEAAGKGFLVETASRGGEETGQPPPRDRGAARAAIRWRTGWRAAPAIAVSVAMIGAGTSTLLSTAVALPQTGTEWVTAAAAFVLAMSLSHALAACALSGCGRHVYSPAGWRRWLTPYFAVDGRDAFMGGRLCEVAVAIQRLSAPFLAATAAGFLGSSPCLAGSLIAVLAVTSPFGGTAAHALLHAVLRRQHRNPRNATRFLNTRLFTQALTWREHMREERYLLLYSLYAVGWLSVVSQWGFNLLRDRAALLGAELLAPVNGGARWSSAAALAVLLAAAALPVAYIVLILIRSGWRVLAPRVRRGEPALLRAARHGTGGTDDPLVGFLRGTLLFSQVPSRDLAAIAAAMSEAAAKPGAVILREREAGTMLCVVHSGQVEVLKETECGDSAVVARLGPGDVFGEIALLNDSPRTSTVRAVEPTRLLLLPRAAFADLVVSSLGAERVRTIVQVAAFLRRTPLFAEWPPQAVMKLAGELSSVPVRSGDVLIREGEPNEAFFLVYEGSVDVRRKGRSCATLGPGDFCGEISLLRGTRATADVVALGPGRCLRVGKAAFLDLVTEDAVTGSVVESVMEARLAGAGTP